MFVTLFCTHRAGGASVPCRVGVALNELHLSNIKHTMLMSEDWDAVCFADCEC